MREERITKVVPEHTVESIFYIAKDGAQFISKSACENYEQGLAILSHPVFRSRVDGIGTLDEGRNASLYHITSDDDYEFFSQHRGDCETDYDKHGPGWYIYYEISDGDYDSQWLRHLDTYIKNKENEIKEFVRHVKAAIEERKSE